MKVLGLTGKAGSGKDYTYSMLHEFYFFRGLTAVRLSFGDELRYEIEHELDTFYIDALWKKPYSEPVRWLLQNYGTEFRRAQDEDYWVNKVKNNLIHADFVEDADLVAITDLRFANEAQLVRDFGGMVVEVQSNTGRAGKVPAHSSEVIDFKTDAVVINNDTPTLPPALLEFLGLNETCDKCRKLERHIKC